MVVGKLCSDSFILAILLLQDFGILVVCFGIDFFAIFFAHVGFLLHVAMDGLIG